MKSGARRVAFGAFATASVAAVAACVDLFHATDFPTLCEHDAAACVAETSTPPDADVPDTAEASAPIDLCAASGEGARRRAEHACGWLGACLGTTEETTFGQCMVRALAAYDCSFNPSLRPRGKTAVLWDCLAKADSCDAVALCVFGTPAPRCPGDAGGTYTTCNTEADEDGNFDAGPVFMECGESTAPIGMDPCVLRGRSCVRVDISKSLCAGGRRAACKVAPRCDDTFAVQCKSAGGIDSDEGVDCALFGDGRCALDDAGVACAPVETSAACTGTAKVVCNDAGTTAESCVDGRTVALRCGAIGQGCNAAGVLPVDPALACKNLDAGSACSDAEEDDCDGGTLRSCARGTRFELPCTSVPGLGACTKGQDRRAACSAP